MTTLPHQGRQIIAIGGVSSARDVPLFGYVLRQSAAAEPKVGFLPTASGDSAEYLDKFYETFSALPCRPSHLKLFGRVSDPAAYLRDQDVVLVSGGNTKSMLGVWREWAIDVLLRQAWESGTVLAGFSAGAICWFEQGLSDAWAERLAPVSGLGFLRGSCCPHYGNEPNRRPVYHQLLLKGEISAGLGISDGCAVHFRGTSPACVVAVQEESSARSVSVEGASIHETPLEIERVRLSAA
jgi:peptidase E